jgi:transposase
MPLSATCTCSSCPAHSATSTGVQCEAVYPSSLTDEQWSVLEPLLPPPASRTSRGGRSEKHPRRRILEAIFYLVRGGVAWRYLPGEFPPWQTVYGFFARWRADGTWQRVHDALRERVRVAVGRKPAPTAAIIDSQSVRAAATVGRHSRGYDGGKRVNGRKRHIAVDTCGLLLVVLVTIASIQDRDGGLRLLTLLRERFSTISLVWADGGYAGRLVELAKRVLKFTVEVVKRTDDVKGFKVVPRRWVVERTFAWLFTSRRLVHDYERRQDSHEAMIYLSMSLLMIRRLAPMPKKA